MSVIKLQQHGPLMQIQKQLAKHLPLNLINFS